MTNKYFNFYPATESIDNESLFLEDHIVESIEIMGHECYYLPRESFDAGDMILGEYSKSFFKKAYLVDCYIPNVEGFEGDGDYFGKFGLEIRDTSNFVLAKRTFRKIVPSALRDRPREGDLLYVPVFHRMFEVKFIEEELMFFSLGKRNPYCYEMRCELFRYSQEPIDTGVEMIDEIREGSSYTIKLTLGAGSGDFTHEGTAFQSANGIWNERTSSGYIREWFKGNSTIFITEVIGQFNAGANLYCNTSNAVYMVNAIDDMSNFNINRDFFDNITLKDQANNVLDFTESNPFGNP